MHLRWEYLILYLNLVYKETLNFHIIMLLITRTQVGDILPTWNIAELQCKEEKHILYKQIADTTFISINIGCLYSLCVTLSCFHLLTKYPNETNFIDMYVVASEYPNFLIYILKFYLFFRKSLYKGKYVVIH